MTKKDADLTNQVARLDNRVAVKKYYYNELPQQIRTLSFTVANLETLRQIQMVQRSLINAMDEGLSFKEWKEQLDVEVLKRLSEARLETVYRTNVNTVYNQSTRYNAMTSNVVPYLMYSAVGDERTRPEHLELDGVVKRADSKFWDSHTPPLGFNCRCGMIPLSKEDAEDMGINKQSNNSFPDADDGFGNKRMGDMLSSVEKETERAISNMPKSALKSKFEKAQENVKSLVDIWYESKKDIFRSE